MKGYLNKLFKYILNFCGLAFLLSIALASTVKVNNALFELNKKNFSSFPPDTNPPDTTLPYNFNDNDGNPYDDQQNGGLYLNNPSNVKNDVIYDPETNQYILKSTVGDNLQYRPSSFMDFNEYRQYDMDKALQQYWRDKTKANRLTKGDGSLIPKIRIGGEVFDRIFGGNTIDIRPSGSAELIFGVVSNFTDNPALDQKLRRNTNFDFQEKIQMNVTAKIGDKIQFGVNYNTEASFDFENKMNLKYEGKEDEIIQLIEGGDVSMPLQSTLITGSQSLFGIKTKLKFGRAMFTAIYSQQKSKTENITVAGGAQTSEFNLKADQYEENRHFFLAQYHRNNYSAFLQKLPVVNSPINITKIEVWVTNVGAAVTENRNIIAFQDIGEKNPYSSQVNGNPYSRFPDDSLSNNLFYGGANLDKSQLRDLNNANNYLSSKGFTSGVDYEKVELARKLSPTEFTYNSKLGFISLNTALNSDQVLAIAYQFTVVGDTTVYQVGDFSNGGIQAPKCLIVKLLKGTQINTKIPIWKLMMKNVYPIGGYQIKAEDFRLNVLYSGSTEGVPMGYLTEGKIDGVPLIRALGCDRLNIQLDPVPDGVFDFVDMAAVQGGTIQAANGRVFFPVLEPFGKDLRRAIIGNGADSNQFKPIADNYCYDSLYTLTKTGAQQYPDKNKFNIAGFFKSASGSEISLGAMNVPQGSVKVTAGGIPLRENIDYTVDYTLGRVKIINEGILNSGTPINISLESNSMFDIQTKTLMGLHVDYMINKNFNLGATVLNLTEKPLTQKVNYGDEPISNTILGVNGDYQTESRLITKLVDAIPFINTKAISNLAVSGEFAQLIPGHSKAIGKTGTTYIDDFEAAKSSIDIKNIGSWFTASTPQGQGEYGMFPESNLGSNNLAFGYNRAKLAWYVIAPETFYRGSQVDVSKAEISNHYTREIKETEVFPQKQNATNIEPTIAVLNLSYYPEERGPYNYDVDGMTNISSGIDANGKLKDPATRWGGIMRKLETTDFEATNVEYVEFWMMDPFKYNPTHSGGYMYLNLGEISEDVLRDSRKSAENALPLSDADDNIDYTIWARVSRFQALTNSFDNSEDAAIYQDVGLDGMRDDLERGFFNSSYLQIIANTYGAGSQAYINANNDPSGDNYRYFRGPDFDAAGLSILKRYKNYNNTEGNSITNALSKAKYGVDYPMQATNIPDVEDINRDNTLNETEKYFQYQVELRPGRMSVGQNYISDIMIGQTGQLPDGTSDTIKWYQFKVPIQNPDRIVNGIQDFKSIRFMRMFLKGFTDSIICRFATLDIVRSEWRRYKYSLLLPGEYIPTDDVNLTGFEISAVNIEENSERDPIPYVVPPGIEREINLGTTNLMQMNEQSLSLKVTNLLDGDARAVYKTCDFDMRQFKTLKMFVHEEKVNNSDILNTGDLTVFIRLGADFTQNYYEYEVSMTPTPWYTSSTDDITIWPSSNEMQITLNDLVDLKKDRNTAMNQSGSSVSTLIPYVGYDDLGRRMTVVGNPSISAVKTIMIGIRNPKRQSSSTVNDDGQAKSAEVWVNELRLTDFDENGGSAATGRISATLADFGNISFAGLISTPGFGSIDKKVNERSKDLITQYDIATNLELGKFFGEKSGVKIPMHFDFSELKNIPQYDPLSPDILYKESLATYATKAQKDSVKKITQDVTRRKSINFMNVRKTKVGANSKSHIYDIENFDVSYAYTEIFHRNIDIEYDRKKNHRGGFGYNFNNNPKNVKPFDKVKFLQKAKYLRLIKDFNFFYLPKVLAFRTELNREFQENLMRNKTNAIIILEPTYVKMFSWMRDYVMKFDLTQGLKVDYHALANARIDEPPGKVDKSLPDYKQKRDSVWTNVLHFGRMTTYTQSLDINYTVPINKIPILNWISMTARYGGVYNWNSLPMSTDSNNKIILNPLGNNIENSNTKQLNTSANLLNFYNKIPYLKKVNDKKRGIDQQRRSNMPPTEEDSLKPKVNILKEILDNTLGILMLVKSASLNYQEGNGKALPGFLPSPQALGMNFSSPGSAPGWDFVFGNPSELFGAYKDIRTTAYKNDWISHDTNLFTPFILRQTKSLNAQVTAELFRDFRIDVTATSSYSKQFQEYLRYNTDGTYKSYSPAEVGNFSTSYVIWSTAFLKDKDGYSSQAFENFKENRLIIANRLAVANPYYNGAVDSAGFPTGYGATSQEVLIPAFLAAYAGKNTDKISLKPFSEKLFKTFPIPNWRITYTGLSKIKFLKKWFKTISLSHSYRGTYNIAGYTTNIRFNDEDNDGFTKVRDALGNFLSQKQIDMIAITEQFAPLIGFDMTMVNSIMIKFEIKKSRNLAFSFANNQLTEVSSSEYVLGAGYKIKDLSFTLNLGGRKRPIKSDLNIKADLSIRNNKTVLRKLIENMDQISAGQRVISINISADYQLSEKLSIRVFFDDIINNPFVSSQFPNSNISGGISLRFTLAQ